MGTLTAASQAPGSRVLDAQAADSKRLSLLTLVFAILSVVFFLLLILFRRPFPAYPLISYQDVFDLVTPMVLIPMYWLLFRPATSKTGSGQEEIVFMVLAAAWVLGQGMHLAANSIDNLAEGLARTQQIDIIGTSIYQLTYWFDEHLSHVIWHIGIVGLAGLLMYRAWNHPFVPTSGRWMTILGSVLYGLTLFCIFLEGQTVILGLPFTALVTLLCLLRWKEVQNEPLVNFFFVSCLLALLLFLGWGLYWKGFPQFSDVGLI